MTIKRIKISNFKSFKNLDVELGKFNILIGANASGKSNFIRAFEFLRDISNHGLDNAISMQGGIEYLRNINLGSSETLCFEIFSDDDLRFAVKSKEKEEGPIGIKIYESIYKFAIKFRKKGYGFNIIEDNLILKCNIFKLKQIDKKTTEEEKLGDGIITIFGFGKRVKGINLKLEINVPSGKKVQIDKNDIIPQFMREAVTSISKGKTSDHKFLILEQPFSLIPVPWAHIFSSSGIYDFEPKLSKKATQITGKAELEEDGENLAIIVKNILENPENERKLSNLVRDLLPFVAKLDVEKFSDKSLLFRLREVYSKRQYLPGSLISDGTINITAIILALYFEKRPITIIEEPERNIHPSLISKIVNMMQDASEKQQILITTHNPEMIKHADLKSILLVSRDKEGFSTISRPAEKEEVKMFLKNEMGIEELYVQNLLGI
jgi:predicted ATPase